MIEDDIINDDTRRLAINKGWDVENVMHCLLTQSKLQKWLREKHNCIVEVPFTKYAGINKLTYFSTVDYYRLDWNFINPEDSDYTSEDFDKYEYALETGLYEALKLL